MDIDFKIQGLDEVVKRFKNMPEKLDAQMSKAMDASLKLLHGNVLPYPPQRENMVSKYVRTGTLGRTLGAQGAKPTIYSMSGSGGKMVGKFGTNLIYAKYVIGEEGAPSYPPGQAKMHKGWWWTIGMILERSRKKMDQLWKDFVDKALNKL